MNGQMKKIGVVVAIEIGSVLARYGAPAEVIERRGYRVHVYEQDRVRLYVADSGAGQLAAAMTTQFLISEFDVSLVINFGVVGALTEEMTTAELCVVERVVHYEFDTADWLNLPLGQHPEQDSPFLTVSPALVQMARMIAPALRPVTCASGDKFVSQPDRKAALHAAFDADICEMEAAGVAYTCRRNGVECLSIKAVSDSLTGGGHEFFTELERVSALCFDVVDQIVRSL